MIRGLALCLALTLASVPVHAAPSASDAPHPGSVLLTPPAQCEAAIAATETDMKLPVRVLNSIAMRESGRVDPGTGRARPWPWTINYLGQGRFFATKDEAIAAVREIQASGGQSVDVGCMQVNLMHHPNAFSSLEEAFDPRANAAYAGRFLKALFGSLNDWGMAIAGYHSLTPGVGEPYRDMVVATWKPTDPEVLARLTFQPLPAYVSPLAGIGRGSGPRIGAAPIPLGGNMSYRAFVQAVSNYRDFRPRSAVYAAFAPRQARARGTPLDLRVGGGLGRGLVTPKGVIDHGGLRSDKAPARRSRESG